jgi:hypothetical protein
MMPGDFNQDFNADFNIGGTPPPPPPPPPLPGNIAPPTVFYPRKLNLIPQTPSQLGPAPPLAPNTPVYANQPAAMFLKLPHDYTLTVERSASTQMNLTFTRPDGTAHYVNSPNPTSNLYVASLAGRPFVVYNTGPTELNQTGWWQVCYDAGFPFVSDRFAFYVN